MSGQSSGGQQPRRLTKAEREAREKRRRKKRIMKYIRFFGAWALLAAVIVLIIVLIVSCVKKSSRKNEGGSGGNGTVSTEQGSMESQDAGNAGETGGSIASETGTGGAAGEETTSVQAQTVQWDGETAEEMIESGKAKKIVFLTFDDGPSPQTSRLLDILKKYNVKVTFFVVGWEENLMDTLKREAEEGHTVAVHSYTHSYQYIYTGEDVFWEDNAQMRDIIIEQTGIVPDLMRFPGGASNHVSADYNSGIMTRLTESVEDHGYDYVDWNVSSGDGGATAETSEIYQRVIEGIESKDISVVLMHDSHDYSVNAVEDIIKYCLDKGYTMLPLHKGIYTCHHGVWN